MRVMPLDKATCVPSGSGSRLLATIRCDAHSGASAAISVRFQQLQRVLAR